MAAPRSPTPGWCSTAVHPRPLPWRGQRGYDAGILGVVLLLGGCTGYVPSPTPVPIPTVEVVRIPLRHTQRLEIWTSDPFAAGGTSPAPPRDTLLGVTAVYGRVRREQNDSLLVELTQVSQHGHLLRLPAARFALVDQRAARPIERWGPSRARTKALAWTLGSTVVVVGLGLALLVYGMSQDQS